MTYHPKSARRPARDESWFGKPASKPEVPTGRINLTKLQRRPFKARSINQQEIFETLGQHDLTFLVGPAGTGKTLLAAAQAIEDMASGRATKLILTRAAVEAGDSIGFLPGDVSAKMSLYCQPVLDALGLFLGKGCVQTMLDQGIIEMIPLTYLRGKSVPDAVIIVDEFQNATPHQGKLCLTRAGENTRVLITCDPGQIDLPDDVPSAADDIEIFRGLPGIAIVEFTAVDVVRSKLCSTVLLAYEAANAGRQRAA